MSVIEIPIREVIGKGYNNFYNCRKRYRIVKGSRASKKSCTAALYYILKLMNMPLANLIVLRRYQTLHKDSTFAQLQWAIAKLGVQQLWETKLSPLEIIYKPTKQKIVFRGFDDPLGITSITTAKGAFCWAWIEEMFQIETEDHFNKLDLSLRGSMPPGYFKQITGLLNPWDENHWSKKRFFDNPDEDTFTDTTTYLDNEFLGDDDIKVFEKMKVTNPDRYLIEGLGEWGKMAGRVYKNWTVQEFDYEEIAKKEGAKKKYGLDFGFSPDPAVFLHFIQNDKEKTIYICTEDYRLENVNEDIADIIKERGAANCKIIADNAEPKSIKELQRLGIRRIEGVSGENKKIKSGIKFLQGYQIIVHPSCINIIREFTYYCWKEKSGIRLAEPIDDYNHGLDCLRYAALTDRVSEYKIY